MDIPFIRVTDLKRKVHGISKTEALALASKSDVFLCVLLDTSDKVLGVVDPFGMAAPNRKIPELKHYKTQDSSLSFNVKTNSVIAHGLFRISATDVQRLFIGKPIVTEKQTDVLIVPYPVDNGITMRLDAKFFGDDPLSKLVIPAEELEKLMVDSPGHQNRHHLQQTEPVAYKEYKELAKEFFDSGLHKRPGDGERTRFQEDAMKKCGISKRTEERYYSKAKKEFRIS